MSDEQENKKVRLQLKWTDYASKNLALRIGQFENSNGHIEIDERTAAIHFLRGTASRAGLVLPALYIALGARAAPEVSLEEHWKRVQAAALEHSALHTIALSCRSIFDDSRAGLSGKRIARLSDPDLAFVAAYWAKSSKKPEKDAMEALRLLRKLFARCAHPAKYLLHQPSLLERRIGLLRYFADRQAAHISTDNYLFDLLDLIHVVASVVLIDAIILDFDSPHLGQRYFDSIDEAGWLAAKNIFPAMEIDRIFHGWDIHQQAALKWKNVYSDGVEYILNQLPAAIGYWDSRPDAASKTSSNED